MSLEAGARLGPYEISVPLGAGAWARFTGPAIRVLGRTVAIKVLPSDLASSVELKQRFEREARAISSLQHPNICTLHDIGSQDGVDFLVMEYLEGRTLAERLAEGALPLDQALKVGVEIADALDKAHRQGIIHRDLKPGNIMLTRSGAKLMDFGPAKPAVALAVGATGPATPATPTMSVAYLTAAVSPVTQRGTIVGTCQYMAPETLQGSQADVRSDLFSFGCVLYEMVTGRPAFGGKSQLSVLTAILEQEPEPIAVIQPLASPALHHLVCACLAKDPDRRTGCAHDLKLELEWLASAALDESGKNVGEMAAPEMPVSVRFSRAGNKLLTVAGQPRSSIWVTDLGRHVAAPFTFEQDHQSAVWSPDGNYIAYCERGGTARYFSIWEKAASGTEPPRQLLDSGGDDCRPTGRRTAKRWPSCGAETASKSGFCRCRAANPIPCSTTLIQIPST